MARGVRGLLPPAIVRWSRPLTLTSVKVSVEGQGSGAGFLVCAYGEAHCRFKLSGRGSAEVLNMDAVGKKLPPNLFA